MVKVKNNIYPVLFHRVVRREEYGQERVYVQGLQWSVREGDIRPTMRFLHKTKGFYFQVTDDIDAFLRQKIPRCR